MTWVGVASPITTALVRTRPGPNFLLGLDAMRPAVGFTDELWYSTDTQLWYYGTGTGWAPLSFTAETPLPPLPYSVGDTFYADTPSTIARLPVGNPDDVLGVNAVGLPAWGPGSASSSNMGIWRWLTPFQSAGPISAGRITVDASPTPTVLVMSVMTDTGIDATVVLQRIQSGDLMYIQAKGASANFMRLKAMGPAAIDVPSKTAVIPVALSGTQGGTIINNTQVVFALSLGGGGVNNPMTALGDLIVGGTNGSPGRLGVGSAGQVLTVVAGVPAWAVPAFVNPMTSVGDLIVGLASGAPSRLAVGANGLVLKVASGTPSWAPDVGFANPMTTSGDVIVGGASGVAQRLAPGTNGQRLSIVGGTPTWVTGAPAGQCRLVKSGANLVLQPFAGNKLSFPDGTLATVPSAGVSLAPTGLTVGTTYFIYAVQTAGVVTSLEASTSGHATDTASGIEIKFGDATRVLVGMGRPITGPAWQDTATQRFVASWFNRRPVIALMAPLTAGSTTSGTLAEVNVANRVEWLTWADAAVRVDVAIVANNGTAGSGAQMANIIDGVVQTPAVFAVSASANYQFTLTSFYLLFTTDGYHYSGYAGSIVGAGQANFISSGIIGATVMI